MVIASTTCTPLAHRVTFVSFGMSLLLLAKSAETHCKARRSTPLFGAMASSKHGAKRTLDVLTDVLQSGPQDEEIVLVSLQDVVHVFSTTALGWRLRKVAPTTNRPLTDFRTWEVNKECSLVTLTVTIPALGDRALCYEEPVFDSNVKAAKEAAAQSFLQEPSVKKLLQSHVESPKKTRGREFMQRKSSSSSLPVAKQPKPCMNTEISQF